MLFVVDLKPMFVMEHTLEYQKRRATYKRRLYCIEKLRLMACQKPCRYRRHEYAKMLSSLKQLEFDTIEELREQMSNTGNSRFYKYIYMVY